MSRERRSRRLWTLLLVLSVGALPAKGAEEPDEAEIFSVENSVEAAGPSAAWLPATVGQKLALHDRVRTGEDSRAAVRLSDLSILRLDELTEAEILPPTETASKPTVDLKQGTAYFFSREKSREINVRTPAANGGIRGTEFVVTVAADGATSFTMIEGEVVTSNESGSLVIRSGERAEIRPGGKPAKDAVSKAIDFAQWCFYYPGVLSPKEMGTSLNERDEVRASLDAYAEGDLLNALQKYPAGREPASSEEKIYRAGLLLFAGQVDKAAGLLEELDKSVPNRQAIATLIAAITLKESKSAQPPQTASEWLAQSYYLQSQDHLIGALQAAQRATALDPDFGFGWTRVAELEFGQDHAPQAKKALEKALSLAPRNPAAHALRGSILSAEGRLDEAKDSFERAMALESALGDAWFGRGLCLIRQGQAKAGQRDILTASALEPNRVKFRKSLEETLGNANRNPTTRNKPRSRSETTKSSKPARTEPARRPDKAETPERVYPGRIPGSGISIYPNPNFPTRNPRPRPTATPRPTAAEKTPRPEPTKGSTPRRRDGSVRSTPPARDRVIGGVPANQDSIKERKKKPRARQSPTPP